MKSSYLSILPLNSVGLFTDDFGVPPPAAGAAAAGRFWVIPWAIAFWMAFWNAIISNCWVIVGFGIGFDVEGRFCIGIPRGGIGLYAKNASGSLGSV